MKFFEAENDELPPPDDASMPPDIGGDPSGEGTPPPAEPIVVKSVDVWDILKKYLDVGSDENADIEQDNETPQPQSAPGIRPPRTPA